ncbi:MAG TPA: porin [Planctomycetaceae bacterium]
MTQHARRVAHQSNRLPESGVIIINQQPTSPLLYLGDSASTPFVPIIEIPAKYQQLMNLQVAVANGPLWAQAEWYGTWIAQTGGAPVFFHGSYASIGWFITGEHRGYAGPNGGLGAVHVNRPFLVGPAGRGRERGRGAWELVGRFSYLDFFDPNTPLSPSGSTVGIKLPEWTFGVNWYLADHVRLMFNYVYALPNEPNAGASAANEYAMRLGVFW